MLDNLDGQTDINEDDKKEEEEDNDGDEDDEHAREISRRVTLKMGAACYIARAS